MTPPSQPAPDNRPSPALIVFLVVPLLGIVIALLMVMNDARPQPLTVLDDLSADSARLINYTAPDFELPDLDGNTVKLSDFRGRVLFLNFWQTTCEPCIRELPALAEFAEAQGETGAAVLTINFEETSEQVRDFFAANEISGVPVVLDATSVARRQYGVVAIPRTFIIDAEGVIRSMKIGEITVSDMEAYLETLQPS